MNRLRTTLPLFALIAIGIALIASGALDRFSPEHLVTEQTSLKAYIAAHWLLASMAYVGLMTLCVATGIPGALIIVMASGMLFGVAIGTFLSAIGLTFGALILFLASRSALAHGHNTAPALVEKLRTGYHAHPISYTMFLRLVPFFPFGAVTVALAWLRCPLWLFLTASATGGTVMLAFETALGAGLADTLATHGKISLNVFAEPRVIFPMLGLALLALIPIGLNRLRRQNVTAQHPRN